MKPNAMVFLFKCAAGADPYIIHTQKLSIFSFSVHVCIGLQNMY